MPKKQYLLADPENVLEGSRDRDGMLQAFRDMYDCGMDAMHDFCTSRGKLSVSCPRRSGSGFLAVFFKPSGWDARDAAETNGSVHDSQEAAARECHRISDRK